MNRSISSLEFSLELIVNSYLSQIVILIFVNVPKGDESWVFIGRTDVEAETLILWPPILWCKELTHCERPWCWEILRAGGEGDDRGWDGWMASPTPWTWVWLNSRSWWWTGRPGVLWFMGLQRVGHDWLTELNWYNFFLKCLVELTSEPIWTWCFLFWKVIIDSASLITWTSII